MTENIAQPITRNEINNLHTDKAAKIDKREAERLVNKLGNRLTLEVMHALESDLTPKEKAQYVECLSITSNSGIYSDYYDGWQLDWDTAFNLAHATIAQRFEAYITIIQL